MHGHHHHRDHMQEAARSHKICPINVLDGRGGTAADAIPRPRLDIIEHGSGHHRSPWLVMTHETCPAPLQSILCLHGKGGRGCRPRRLPIGAEHTGTSTKPLAKRRERVHARHGGGRLGARAWGPCPAVALSSLFPLTVSAPHVSFHERVGGARAGARRQSAGCRAEQMGGFRALSRLFSLFASAWISWCDEETRPCARGGLRAAGAGRPADSCALLNFNAASVFFTSS